MRHPSSVLAGCVRRFSILSFAAALGVAHAADPSAGTLSPDNPQITFTGGPYTQVNTSGALGDYVCDDSNYCDTFALTVDLPVGYLATHPQDRIKVHMH